MTISTVLTDDDSFRFGPDAVKEERESDAVEREWFFWRNGTQDYETAKARTELMARRILGATCPNSWSFTLVPEWCVPPIEGET